ncbi:MAG TPA: EcsC family protein [Casimicrobiaceae bacterium]
MAYSYSLPSPTRVESVIEAIGNVVAAVPESRQRASEDPATAARVLSRKAAQRAAAISGALALPPGVIGMLTVLPDLAAIWRIQAQMVSDIAGLYGREMELTRTHMLYCLFRHAASQLARDVVVRTGQRIVVRELSGGALRSLLANVGISVTQRVVGSSATRWVPLIGAAAVAGYAYYDTVQVAKTAGRMLHHAEAAPR